MSKHFVLNRKTVGQLLKSEDMSQALQDAAQQLATQAGVGYQPLMMGTRVIVVSVTEEAEQDNLNNNTLLKVAHQ